MQRFSLQGFGVWDHHYNAVVITRRGISHQPLSLNISLDHATASKPKLVKPAAAPTSFDPLAGSDVSLLAVQFSKRRPLAQEFSFPAAWSTLHPSGHRLLSPDASQNGRFEGAASVVRLCLERATFRAMPSSKTSQQLYTMIVPRDMSF